MLIGKMDEQLPVKLDKGMNISGWSIENEYLELKDAYSKTTLPYLFIRTVKDDLAPWLASQTGVFANDWVIG